MTINAGKYMFEDTSSDTDVVLETNPPNIMNRIRANRGNLYERHNYK